MSHHLHHLHPHRHCRRRLHQCQIILLIVRIQCLHHHY
ncbi:unnamed protein product [Trichobilharzia regenti]|nr:unnamed protein product [Trichobilharzia regenti]